MDGLTTTLIPFIHAVPQLTIRSKLILNRRFDPPKHVMRQTEEPAQVRFDARKLGEGSKVVEMTPQRGAVGHKRPGCSTKAAPRGTITRVKRLSAK